MNFFQFIAEVFICRSLIARLGRFGLLEVLPQRATIVAGVYQNPTRGNSDLLEKGVTATSARGEFRFFSWPFGSGDRRIAHQPWAFLRRKLRSDNIRSHEHDL